MAEDIEVTPSTLGAESPAPAEGGGAPAPESDSPQSWSPEVQAEYTKKTQALADERKAWESQRDQHNSQMQQQAQQLRQYAAQLQQRQQQPQQPQQQRPDPYQSLRDLSFLDGGTAAQLFQGVQKAIGNILNIVKPKVLNKEFSTFKEFDNELIKIDGTKSLHIFLFPEIYSLQATWVNDPWIFI